VDLQKALADSGSTLPIVFMTAYEDDGVRQEIMERGAVAFLQKPVDEQTLLKAIKKASERRRKSANNLTGISQVTS